MKAADIEKLLGDQFLVRARSNGQIAVGIANERLASMKDADKVKELEAAHKKLSTKYGSIGTFADLFKAGSPPRGPDDKDKQNKPIWRQYLHLLLTPEQHSEVSVSDQRAKYMSMLLAANPGLSTTPEVLMGLVNKLLGEETPAPSTEVQTEPDAVIDEVPI